MTVARLHLVDGTYELYRAHFAPRPEHRDPSGADRKATVGLVASLLSLLSEPDEAVTHLAVAFDNPIRSFRNDLFPDYKSDEGVPPELRAQFDLVEEAVRALGVVVWSMREHEADDGLASGARRVHGRGRPGADHDAGTRISRSACGESASCRSIDGSARTTDEATFRATRGYGPASVPGLSGVDRRHRRRHPGAAGVRREGSASLLVGARTSTSKRIPGRSVALDGEAARRPAARRHAGRPAAGRSLLSQAGDSGRRRAVGRVAGRPPLPRRAARPLRGLVRRHRRPHPPHGAPALGRGDPLVANARGDVTNRRRLIEGGIV